MFDIGHFGVWCEAFTVNFGHVVLPHAQLANVPPSLKMLGVSPQVGPLLRQSTIRRQNKKDDSVTVPAKSYL